tara:strand:- start:3525 stop:4886 length:1362 start_codon:yes stop_codon:yes gene_type:complete
MPELKQILKQQQKLSPQQILQTVLLQLTSVDLEKRILDELEENPALDMSEPTQDTDEENENEMNDENSWEDFVNSPEDYNFKTPVDRSAKRKEMPLAETTDYIDHLLSQIRMMDLSDVELKISEEIIWNLDDKGYLAVELILIADRMDATEEEVEKILKIVQRLDPPGYGARNLQECLEVQLEVHNEDDLAVSVVRDHFNNFANRRFEEITNALKCTQVELNEVYEIVGQLNPKPGEGAPTTDADSIIPDIILEQMDDEWMITINDYRIPDLQVSTTYLNMLVSKDAKNTESRKFAKRKVESAQWFIQAIQQRQMTMTKVMKTIIDLQPDFFVGELEKLHPMILKDVAERINMDVSTVSRVTRGKYVQTPFGMFELKSFFSEGMMTEEGKEVSNKIVKEALKKIIEEEDKHKPYSDDKLAQLMKEDGYPLARRTATKYREQMKIPVARLRREI